VSINEDAPPPSPNLQARDRIEQAAGGPKDLLDLVNLADPARRHPHRSRDWAF